MTHIARTGLFLLFAFIALNLSAQGQYNQIGEALFGVAVGDNFGYSVSSSADGSKIIVGAYAGSSNLGEAKVFEWTGVGWKQIGQTLSGEAANDFFGSKTVISKNGKVIAVGAPGKDSYKGEARVYSLNGDNWEPRGGIIRGTNNSDQTGASISLSSSGDVMAIGSFGKSGFIGAVQIYAWNGSSWSQLGTTINGSEVSQFGESLSLSTDGKTLVVGGSVADANNGVVKVFKWDGYKWEQQGSTLRGVGYGKFGASVAVSGDGTAFIVGSPNQNTLKGAAQVFSWDGSEWVRKGEMLNGSGTGLVNFGNSVDMSGDGLTIAVGAPNKNSFSGEVEVFVWDGNTWIKSGETITGFGGYELFGTSFSLSDYGDQISIGGHGFNSATGNVKSFKFTDCLGATVSSVFLQEENCGVPSQVTIEFLAGGTNGDISDFANNQWQLGYATAGGTRKFTPAMPIDSFTRTGNSFVRTANIQDFSIDASAPGATDTKTWRGEVVTFYAYQICTDGFPYSSEGKVPNGYPGGVMPNTDYLIYAKSSWVR